MHGAKQRVNVFVIESVYVEVNVYNIINYLCSSCSPAQSPPCCTNVTAHPSTDSVPITVLLYDGLLLWGFNVAIKWLIVAEQMEVITL